MFSYAPLAVAALCAASAVFAFGPVIVRLISAWWTVPDFAHGFVIAPLAAYFAWERRTAFQQAPAEPHAAGLVLVMGSLALLVGGHFAADVFITRLSLIGALIGTVWFCYGTARLRVLRFPLALLALAIPPPALLMNQLTLPLQFVASDAGERLLSAAGVPVVREGNLLVLPGASLEIAEACSGIRSLISLLTLGILYAQFSERRPGARLAIVLSTIPIAIATNALRVAAMGVVAYAGGADMTRGFVHTLSGWLLFAVAFAMLVGVRRGLCCARGLWRQGWMEARPCTP